MTWKERQEKLIVAQRQADEQLAKLAASQRQADEQLREFIRTIREAESQGLAAIDRLTGAASDFKEVMTGLREVMREVEVLSNRFGFSLEEFVAALLPPYLGRHHHITGLTLERGYFDLGDGQAEEVDLVGTGQRDGQPLTVLTECRTGIKGGEMRRLAQKLDRVAKSIETGEVARVVVAMNVHPSARVAGQETGTWVIPYSHINRERG